MTQPLRILVVDDEQQIHRFLRPSLAASGFDVLAATNGRDALRQLASDRIGVVILDLGLPDMDGKDVLAEIRRRSAVPVIVLSARDREAEKIAALDLGADDYINKPFGIGELLARIRSVLRRRPTTPPEAASRFRIGQVAIDTAAHRVTRAGEPVRLTPKEFDLLIYLARHAGKVVTHRNLLAAVWGENSVQQPEYLRVFVGHLRKKIEADESEPRYIVTEPWVGYRFEPGD
jgi:two-component system KDP operon response regulator KdpE